MSEPQKRRKVARRLKYSSSGTDDFLRRIFGDDDDEGGAGVREPRPDRPFGPDPIALARSEEDASADVAVYAEAVATTVVASDTVSEDQQPA